MQGRQRFISPTLHLVIAFLLLISSQLIVVGSSTTDEDSSTLLAADDRSQDCINPDADLESKTEKIQVTMTKKKVEECKDEETTCKYWKKNGECEKNSHYMRRYCRRSCGVCDVKGPEINRYGVPQTIPKERVEKVKDIIAETIEYMKQLTEDEKYKDVIDECVGQ